MKRSDGDYIDVPYMSDAVLVNLGVLMQMWTADGYLATVGEHTYPQNAMWPPPPPPTPHLKLSEHSST